MMILKPLKICIFLTIFCLAALSVQAAEDPKVYFGYETGVNKVVYTLIYPGGDTTLRGVRQFDKDLGREEIYLILRAKARGFCAGYQVLRFRPS